MKSRALIIFTRNPELGKGKRRLAATVGDQIALDVYKFLLQHTRAITRDVQAQLQVWYSDQVHHNDDWDNQLYHKFTQQGDDLGQRMQFAFNLAFKQFEQVIIIGSDIYDLTTTDINLAFDTLDNHDAVIGPAVDGGYYLLGFNHAVPNNVFNNKNWGTNTVLQDTIADLQHTNFKLLEPRNDVDYYDDIKDQPDFKHLLTKYTI